MSVKLNLIDIIKNYSKNHIKFTSNKSDHIIATSLYWKLRNFVYVNIIIPNKLKISSNVWDKSKIIELFSKYVFKKKPALIESIFKEGWVGWKLNETGNVNSNTERIDINSSFNNFMRECVVKNKRYFLNQNELWNSFKKWWKKTTKKDYFPSKEKFIDYIEDRYLSYSIKNNNDEIGWYGYRLKC